jgi:hypothetical protein
MKDKYIALYELENTQNKIRITRKTKPLSSRAQCHVRHKSRPSTTAMATLVTPPQVIL